MTSSIPVLWRIAADIKQLNFDYYQLHVIHYFLKVRAPN